MIIDHNHPEYLRLANGNFNNGPYHYSKEIVKNIIPLVSSDENGDARIECFYVADEEWVKKNLPNHSLKGMELNDKWGDVQLKGGEE